MLVLAAQLLRLQFELIWGAGLLAAALVTAVAAVLHGSCLGYACCCWWQAVLGLC